MMTKSTVCFVAPKWHSLRHSAVLNMKSTQKSYALRLKNESSLLQNKSSRWTKHILYCAPVVVIGKLLFALALFSFCLHYAKLCEKQTKTKCCIILLVLCLEPGIFTRHTHRIKFHKLMVVKTERDFWLYLFMLMKLRKNSKTRV